MNELVQTYLVAEDTNVQDRAAYAIQENIKVMKLAPKSVNFYSNFSSDVQEVFLGIRRRREEPRL